MAELKFPNPPEGKSLAWLRNFLVSSLVSAKAREGLNAKRGKKWVSYYEPFEFLDTDCHESTTSDTTADSSSSLCEIAQDSVGQQRLLGKGPLEEMLSECIENKTWSSEEVIQENDDHSTQSLQKAMTFYEIVSTQPGPTNDASSPVDFVDSSLAAEPNAAAFFHAARVTGTMPLNEVHHVTKEDERNPDEDTTPEAGKVELEIDNACQWQEDGGPGGQPCEWAVDSHSFVSAGTGELHSEVAIVSESDMNAMDEVERISEPNVGASLDTASIGETSNVGASLDTASIGETSQSLYEDCQTLRDDNDSNEADVSVAVETTSNEEDVADIWSAHSVRSRMRWSDACLEDTHSIGSAGRLSAAEYESVPSLGTPGSGVYHSIDGTSAEHFSSGREDFDVDEALPCHSTGSDCGIVDPELPSDGGTRSAAWQVDTSQYLHAVSVTGRGNVSKSSSSSPSQWTPGLKLLDQRWVGPVQESPRPVSHQEVLPRRPKKG